MEDRRSQFEEFARNLVEMGYSQERAIVAVRYCQASSMQNCINYLLEVESGSYHLFQAVDALHQAQYFRFDDVQAPGDVVIAVEGERAARVCVHCGLEERHHALPERLIAPLRRAAADAPAQGPIAANDADLVLDRPRIEQPHPVAPQSLPMLPNDSPLILRMTDAHNTRPCPKCNHPNRRPDKNRLFVIWMSSSLLTL